MDQRKSWEFWWSDADMKIKLILRETCPIATFSSAYRTKPDLVSKLSLGVEGLRLRAWVTHGTVPCLSYQMQFSGVTLLSNAKVMNFRSCASWLPAHADGAAHRCKNVFFTFTCVLFFILTSLSTTKIVQRRRYTNEIRVWNTGEKHWQENSKYAEKSYGNASFSTQNPIETGLRFNPDLWCERPATNTFCR